MVYSEFIILSESDTLFMFSQVWTFCDTLSKSPSKGAKPLFSVCLQASGCKCDGYVYFLKSESFSHMYIAFVEDPFWQIEAAPVKSEAASSQNWATETAVHIRGHGKSPAYPSDMLMYLHKVKAFFCAGSRRWRYGGPIQGYAPGCAPRDGQVAALQEHLTGYISAKDNLMQFWSF